MSPVSQHRDFFLLPVLSGFLQHTATTPPAWQKAAKAPAHMNWFNTGNRQVYSGRGALAWGGLHIRQSLGNKTFSMQSSCFPVIPHLLHSHILHLHPLHWYSCRKPLGCQLVPTSAALTSLPKLKLQLMPEPPHVLMHQNLHLLLIQITDMTPTDLEESQTLALIVEVLENL